MPAEQKKTMLHHCHGCLVQAWKFSSITTRKKEKSRKLPWHKKCSYDGKCRLSSFFSIVLATTKVGMTQHGSWGQKINITAQIFLPSTSQDKEQTRNLWTRSVLSAISNGLVHHFISECTCILTLFYSGYIELRRKDYSKRQDCCTYPYKTQIQKKNSIHLLSECSSNPSSTA